MCVSRSGQPEPHLRFVQGARQPRLGHPLNGHYEFYGPPRPASVVCHPACAWQTGGIPMPTRGIPMPHSGSLAGCPSQCRVPLAGFPLRALPW